MWKLYIWKYINSSQAQMTLICRWRIWTNLEYMVFEGVVPTEQILFTTK